MNRLRRMARQQEPHTEEQPEQALQDEGAALEVDTLAPEEPPESVVFAPVDAEPEPPALVDPVEVEPDTEAMLVQEDIAGEEVAASLEEPAVTEEEMPVLDGERLVNTEAGEALPEEPAEIHTAPLPAVAQEELTPLPVNAVVDGRYVVQSQLHHSPDRNLYRVTARKLQRCSACGRLSPSDANHCGGCGSPLSDLPPSEFYLMAESYRPEALMQDPSLMELNLYHPNLVPVVDFYSYKPFGQDRYYAVAEPRQGVRLSQLSLPRPGMQVLTWAMQLADALDYLHSNGVVGAGAEADDILVQGDIASLASLQNARLTSEDEESERMTQQSLDLARLAGTVYEAYTGSAASMSPEGILPMPSAAPEQVGAALKAAIEPAQGSAPPISAAQWRDQLARALDAVAELEQPGRPVSFISAALTDVGRLRDQNQDSFGMVEFAQESVERPMRMGLFVVADGMGGHKGGEVASALALQAFSGEVIGRIVAPLVSAPNDRSAPTNEAILQGMVRAVQVTNERIYKARDNRQNDMGTTLVGVLITGGKAYMVNVGDSRVYLFSRIPPAGEASANGYDGTAPLVKATSPLAGTAPLDETATADPEALEEATEPVEEAAGVAELDRSGYDLTQVSVDHSLVHRLVELGQLDAEEAKVHPHRNFIYRSLGGPPPIEVDTFVRTLHPGDRLLLCSDGLNSMIEDAAMAEVLSTEPSAEQAAIRLIELANEAGGHDNITVILIDVEDYLPDAEHPHAMANT